MEIELKVGEWYETADRERVKVIANTAEHIPPHSVLQFIAVDRHGNTTNYQFNGMCRTAGKEPHDIVKQLRDCTGWNWQEPKWRPARPEDVQRTPLLRCRVRVSESGEWSEKGGILIGYTNPQYTSVPWLTDQEGSKYRWEFCEVLDTPAVPPSAIEREVPIVSIDKRLACMIYNAGYAAGHYDTVEGGFTDVHYTEVDSLHNDKVEELIEWFREQAVPSTAEEVKQ